MALRVARHADLGQAVVRAQRGQQRHRVGEPARRLARVAGDDEDLSDAGSLERVNDLAELDRVADHARRQVRDRVVAEVRQAHGEMDGRGHAAAR